MAQTIVFITLGLTLALFIWGRWRYDIVALMALMAVTITGVVPAEQAFAGFAHPAVITVVGVLVVSRGLLNSGIIDLLGRRMLWVGNRPGAQVGAIMALVASISGFLSSMAAAAIFMPLAIRMARRSGNSPSILLMPLAFASLLGATMTLIGSAPNIIIAQFRTQTGAPPFAMFDYTPVGGAVAIAGILFVSLLGWRLIPQRRKAQDREGLFHIEEYTSEVRVPETSRVVGKALRDLEGMIESDVVIVGIVRNGLRISAPSSFETIRAGDILIVEADSDALKELIEVARLELAGSEQIGEELLRSDEVSVMEAVIMPNSPMEGRTARTLNLRWRYGVNLLAVARQGQRLMTRLSRIRFRAGDILLLQGRTETLREALATLRCLPLAERGLRLGQPQRIITAVAIFVGAVTITALGWLPVQVAFVLAALLMVLLGPLTLREAYDSIEWPIVVLLGAMIPVGLALESTGGAQRIATSLLTAGSRLPPVATLTLVLVGTMFLSDVINNAAAAVLMAPIAIGVAQGLGASADPFLMAVSVGASSAFLTPIGHQSNTLVLGPGGYRFGDYWRLGLPLELIITAVAIPLILVVWPLGI